MHSIFSLPLALVLASVTAGQAGGGHANQQQDIKSDQIERWLGLLTSDNYGEREFASRQLAAAGVAALPALEETARLGELETSRRAVGIMGAMLDTADAAQFAATRKALSRIAKEGPPHIRGGALEEINSTPDPELCQEIRDQLVAAIALSDANETHPIVFSDELAEKLKHEPGFHFASGNRFQAFDWRESKQASDHPEVLAYRVQWFSSGWSRWFVPGINDADTKTKDGRMWRYFMDHKYEVISLGVSRGKFRTRDDLIARKKSSDDQATDNVKQ